MYGKVGAGMYKERIQAVLDFIETGLKAEMTAAELAEMAGYSLYHFYRVFQSATGMPVMQYVLKRKLLHAICEIGQGRKKIDVVLEYGFETYAGFYKSFLREIGYTPADYLRKFKAKRPYRINLFQEERMMISHRKAAEILDLWGMKNEKITDVVYGENGEISDTAKYVGDAYVLKYTNDPGNVKKAVSISRALSDAGFPSPVIVPALDGSDYIRYGELYCFLTERVEGKGVPASRIYLEEYREKARYIGEIVGQLDLALAKIDVPAGEADILKTVCERAIPVLKDVIPLEPCFIDRYVNEMGRLFTELPRQIIHRDLNPANIILSDEKWGFIDFDLSEWNVRIFDPCYAASAILSETFEDGNEAKLAKWTEVLKEILLGYDAVARLTDAEKEAVPYVVLSNQLMAASWFAGKDRFREIYDVNVRMTRWIVRNFDKLKMF